MGGKGFKVKLAVCIPNYNRPQNLYVLLAKLAAQIREETLCDQVEICINDDKSPESPDAVIEKVRARYPEVQIRYQINKENMGMDYNFLQSVLISEAEYCWIVGNDDEVEQKALETILSYIENEKFDILVSPFDVYDEEDHLLRTIDPLRTNNHERISFHTAVAEEYDDLIQRVRAGDALFCFLSNVVFKRARWIEHGNMFEDKMGTIFIQMYMNLQTLKEGAIYLYIPEKIIKNHADPSMGKTLKREYDVLIGLNGVIDYFFAGEQRDKLKKCIVNPRINGRMWEFPDGSVMKRCVEEIDSVSTEYYRKYFIMPQERQEWFQNKNILLYGAGNLGRQAAKELLHYSINDFSVYDADPQKQGTNLGGYKIKDPAAIVDDYRKAGSVVVVANNLSLVEIIEMLLQKGIDRIALIN